MCPVVLKGLYDTHTCWEGMREGERSSTHLLTFTRLPPLGGERSEYDEPRSPSWPGPQEPQAHNERHTVVTTCTFMGKRGERGVC